MIYVTLHELGKLSVKIRVHFYLYSKYVSQSIVSFLSNFFSISVLFYIH